MPTLMSRKDLLSGLIGDRIVSVRRQLFVEDYETYDASIREQESDGPIEFTTALGTKLYLTSFTEEMTLDVTQGEMPRLGASYLPPRDISSSEFWACRIGRTITGVDVLESSRQPLGIHSAFGVEIFFDQAPSFVAEYLSDREHLDQIRLTGPYAGSMCRRIHLAESESRQN